MSYLEKAQKLYQMMETGQMMEAFEQFYHNDVVVVDGTEPAREGKDAQRKAIEEWGNMVQEMHGGGVNSITSDEANGITTVESWTEITFKDGNRMKFEEVGVQRWEGDQIVHERFYHSMTE